MSGKKKLNIGVLPGFLISHIIISIAFVIGFYSRLSLPFSWLYKPLEASLFILSNTLFISFLYLIFGFLYALTTKALPNNKLRRLVSLLPFPLIFLGIWYFCLHSYVNGADGTIWLLYYVINIPSGSIIGTMSHSADIQSPLLAVSAAATSVFFFIGMLVKQYAIPYVEE